MMRTILVHTVLAATCWYLFSEPVGAGEPASKLIKAGIIGCDAHALPWTQILNNPGRTGLLAEMTVVAAYPGGSPDIPQSMELLRKSVEPMRALGVEMVDSIEALLKKVDVVLLLSIDGRKHLPEAIPVFAARKPVFIDKPLAASLVDAIKIFRLARQYQVPCFSSSALRFAPGTLAVCNDPKLGAVRGCDAFSPCPIEPHHPDLFWYGIHGVETLFTIMGPGCKSVVRVHADKSDVVVGLWEADGSARSAARAKVPTATAPPSSAAAASPKPASSKGTNHCWRRSSSSSRPARRPSLPSKPWKSWPSWRRPSRASAKVAE